MKRILLLFSILIFPGIYMLRAQEKGNENKPYTENLMAGRCSFATEGENPYFILKPGYQLVLEGVEGGDTVRLVITVLDSTHRVDDVETRVVEENESENGETKEISRNFLAFCRETGSIFYFGEEVDIYKDGKIVKHEGAWQAGGPNKPGVLMPGQIMLGARYYQEIAPGVAMDRAEIISMDETMQTPAGTFTHVLKVKETTSLNATEKEYKYHAPGIGLIKDENLRLVRFGYRK
jgi:hypothetical protein